MMRLRWPLSRDRCYECGHVATVWRWPWYTRRPLTEADCLIINRWRFAVQPFDTLKDYEPDAIPVGTTIRIPSILKPKA